MNNLKELLQGNEAVARGLYEAGVRVVSSYPGTPSTEITESAALFDEIYGEWAPNEKVAAEVAVLVGTKGISDKIGPHYQLVVRRKNYMDNLEVKVELIDASLLGSFRELEALQRAIHDRLKSVLGLETKVTLAEPKSLERFQGKAKRVLDLRNIED